MLIADSDYPALPNEAIWHGCVPLHVCMAQDSTDYGRSRPVDGYQKVLAYLLIGLAVGGVLAGLVPYVLLLNTYAGGGPQDYRFQVLDRGRDTKVAREQANTALALRTLAGTGICGITAALIAAYEVDRRIEP